MTILIGGLAAVLFGIGDLLAGVGGRKDGSPNSPVGIALTASVVGAVLGGIYLFAISDDAFIENDLYWAIAAAVFMASGRPLLYRGMAVGLIVVFAPVFALVALIVPALSVELTPTTTKFGAIVGCSSIVAFVLASITYHLEL